MNVVVIAGNLTRDPELKMVGNDSKPVVNFTLGVTVPKRDSIFVDCTAWNQQAEVIADYCRKGNRLVVSGELGNKTYDDKDGKKVTKWFVTVNRVDLPPKGSNSDAAPASKAPSDDDSDDFPF